MSDISNDSRGMLYSETKFFVSYESLGDLTKQINDYCFKENVELTAVSHDQTEAPFMQAAPLGQEIKTVFTAVIAFKKRKI